MNITVRTAVRGFGEVLITLGVVMLLFVVYQLFYTNFESNRAMDQEITELRDLWGDPPPDGGGETEEVAVGEFEPGQGFAIMYIPRLGKDYAKPVLEGINPDDLDHGLGHYPQSAMPGKVGNFAVAGHRATRGEPFRDLDKLQPGDRIFVETASQWYTYLVGDAPEIADRGGIDVVGAEPGHVIVSPSAIEVINPVPGQADTEEASERYLTLTTCNPRWSSTHRLIVWAHLEDAQPRSDGKPEALLAAEAQG